MTEYFFPFFFISLIASAIIAKTIGEKKEIGLAGTLVIGIFFTPLIALMVAVISRPKKDTGINKQLSDHSPSLTNELQQLSDLYHKQIINEEEYQQLKNRIIRGS